MYGKLFSSMYDGTLVEDWRALVTFQQLIILCDTDGTIDMTHSAISRRTGIPIEHIKAGIEILENPDPFSRTPDDEGRRIIRLDDHRPWGWRIVNHKRYKELRDYDTVREQTRERVKRYRERQKESNVTVTQGNAMKQAVTQDNAQKRHTDTDIDKKDIMSGKPDHLALRAKGLLNHLNEKTGSKFRPVTNTIKPIISRLKELDKDNHPSDSDLLCLKVIDCKCAEWKSDSKMKGYLRPSTLFGSKFGDYLGQADKGREVSEYEI